MYDLSSGSSCVPPPPPAYVVLTLFSRRILMSRLSTILIAAAIGATFAVGCTSPTDENVTGQELTGPTPGGDGTVARMPFDGAPLRIAVAPAGFPYTRPPAPAFPPAAAVRAPPNSPTP